MSASISLAAMGDAAWRELAAGPRLVPEYPSVDELAADAPAPPAEPDHATARWSIRAAA